MITTKSFVHTKALKRKREEGEEGRGREEEIILKRSRLTERSPIKEEGVKIMLRELLEEMREMRRKMKEQKEEKREEIKIIWTEMQEREESWKRERDGLRKEINEIRNKNGRDGDIEG